MAEKKVGKIERYYVYYFDPRGAWREWGDFEIRTAASAATRRLPLKNLPWIIEKRVSWIINKSKLKAPYERETSPKQAKKVQKISVEA